MNKTVLTLSIVLVVLLVGVIVVGSLVYNTLRDDYIPPAPTSSSSSVNTTPVPLPDLKAQDVDGNEVRLTDYQGKPTAILFFASWCGFCKDVIAAFDNIRPMYTEDDLAIILCNVTDGGQETVEKALEYIAQRGTQLPVWLDIDLEFTSYFEVVGLPQMVFIDRYGNMTFRSGSLPQSSLEGVVADITA